MTMRLITLALCVAISFVATASARPLAGLEQFIDAEMAREQAPGLALVVVKDSAIVHERGYGYRDVDKRLLVTPDTLFAIASVTKSFAVLTMGSLVAEGRLDWDRPVKSYVPEFQLFDPFATEHLTLRDMLTHRSGLPRHDWLWYGSGLTRADYHARLRYLQPNAELRGRYQYNNLMYVVAGHLSERLSGMPWDRLVQERIFRPLGMSRSYSDVAAFGRDSEPATPYLKSKQQGSVKIPYANIDSIAPAGSINSTANDMSRYLLALMDDGRYLGKQVLDAATVREMQIPQTIMPDAPRHAELGRKQYGMGLVLSTYRGHSVVSHGGDIDGFTALLAWLPRDKVGVVLLINQGDSQLRSIVSQRVFDLMLRLKPIDWRARYAADRALRKSAEAAKDRPEIELRKPGTTPAHVLDEYVGHYENPAYGTVEISRSPKGLTLSYHQSSIDLNHFHFDVFVTAADEANLLAETKVKFATDLDGEVAGLSMALEPAVDAVVFQRSGGAPMRDPAFLRQFVGTYRLGTDQARILLQESSLMLDFGGRLRRLLPFSGTRFAIDGQADHRIEFLQGDELLYRRPEGAIVGNRFDTTIGASDK